MLHNKSVGRIVCFQLPRLSFYSILIFVFISGSLYPVMPTAVPVALGSTRGQEAVQPPAAAGPGDDSVAAAQALAASGGNSVYLPPEQAGLPEVESDRTAETATFQAGKDSFISVIGAGPLHYRDGQGSWQVINPAFQPYQDSYLVERNSIRSRAGMQKAWLSASVDGTAVIWEPAALGAATTDGGFSPIASVLAKTPAQAKVLEGGNVLDYTQGWSDPTLSERIISAPGSVEHSLMLNQPPSAAGHPAVLELRTTLSLVPADGELWADGQAQTGAFQTASGFEIRAKGGAERLQFEAVRAYEADDPAAPVSGSYAFQPTGKPGVWMVSVKTPWAWWANPARRYPAILDPIIKVNKTTGTGDGMAWVIKKNDTIYQNNYTYGYVALGVVENHGFDSTAEGYVQFNSMPAVLNNAPVKIKAAYLDVETAGFFRPGFTIKTGKMTDWSKETISRSTSLYYIGACPWNPGCTNFFSIHDARLSNPTQYNWGNRPTGTLVGSLPLTLKGPETSSAPIREPVVTTWDVTAQIAGWYDAWSAWSDLQNPPPYPTFRLAFDQICPAPPDFNYANSAMVPVCMMFTMGSGNIRLRVEYDALPVALGGNLLNPAGVPSYLEGVFADSSHFYQLGVPAETHWRGVAVRGNHTLDANLPATRVGLKLWDESGAPVELANALTQSADETAFILVDDHTNPQSGIKSAFLQAEVLPSSENDFALDQQRNYRLNYETATPITPVNGEHIYDSSVIPSDQLLRLVEFDLWVGDKLLLTVDAPPALQVALAQPTGAGDRAGSVVSSRKVILPNSENGDLRTFEFGVETAGKWALVLVNQARPVWSPERKDYLPYSAQLDMLVCPTGTIPTAKFKCQPLRLPDATIPPNKSWKGVTIYSEGGFINNSLDWCTTDESKGTPLIGQPGSPDRWIFVAQGSVCFENAKDKLYTTDNSAVGLAVPIANFNPADKRGDYVVLYGSGAAFTAGNPTGYLVANGSVGPGFFLQPQSSTRRNIKPFERYWEAQTSHTSEILSITRMKLEEVDRVAASVTVDAGQQPLTETWDVTWAYYPNPASSPSKTTFDTAVVHQTPFTMPIDLSTTELRIFNAGVPDGKMATLDSRQQPAGPEAYQFRAGSARLTLSAGLGGASKDVQVVVQPPGIPRLPDGEKSCSSAGNATSCLDLRRAGPISAQNYAWNDGAGEDVVQQWDLPDIHVNGPAALVMISEPGKLDVYSADHPAAKPAAEQSFSFDTWGASVKVTEEACVAGGPVVTVIRGSTTITLPMIGESGSNQAGITAEFKLCDQQLKRTKLSFSIPEPGVPIGNTGLGIFVIDGEVTIGPDSTRIDMGVNIDTMDGVILTQCRGTLTIDTEGMFKLSGSGTLVGIMRGESMIQVAWNPIDLLYEGEVSAYGGFLSGALRMHTWMGQGFQHKYPWLPDDNTLHFSGSIKATITIAEGALIDAWILQIPPVDIYVNLQVAVGEFCAGNPCNTYKWGISGTVSIFGYDAGVYIDSGGPELILGSNDHVLVDQYGGSPDLVSQPADPHESLVPAAIVQTQLPGYNQPYLMPKVKSPVSSWSSPADNNCTGMQTSNHLCSFPIQAGSGRALFVISWQNGDLDISFAKPDGTIITPSNAAANGVTKTVPAPRQVAFSLAPTNGAETVPPGDWKIRLGNVYTGSAQYLKNNYFIMFTTDPPKPSLEWTSLLETSTSPDETGTVELKWSATRAGQPLPADTMLELFYISATSPSVRDDNQGIPITAPIAANQGKYDWQPAGMQTGSYYVGARIDDRKNGNGHLVFWADGVVRIEDKTPPPAPHVLGSLSLTEGAVIVIWEADRVTPDLAGYLVDYTIPFWDASGTPMQRVRKVVPRVSSGMDVFFESVRLGGMRAGFTTSVCVRAFDASRNESECKTFDHTLGEVASSRIGAPAIEAINVKKGVFQISYGGPSFADLAGYFITYVPAGCQLPGAVKKALEGPSPIQVAKTVHQVTLSELTAGQSYRITVYAYSNTGDVSPGASRTVLLVDPGDADHDGMPDQWESLYGLSNPDDDPDQDGLTNLQEFQQGSIPLYADSDQDGYYDGEEAARGNNVCGSGSQPLDYMKPHLELFGSKVLSFTLATNASLHLPQTVQITNTGPAPMDWSASASQSWITLSQTSGSGPALLLVNTNPTGLAPGFYTGTLTLRARPAARDAPAGANRDPSIIETVAIPIQLNVLPQQETRIYLPAVIR